MTMLDGVHPQLVAKAARILNAMDSLGFAMKVTDGLRTAEQQAALYAKGRTTPGPIVTNCNGTTTVSNHQIKRDGWGHAVDCCFVVDGKPSWDDALPWALYGAMARTLGLRWGGDWVHPDRPHIELPDGELNA